MKKILGTLLCAFCLVSSLSAYEWGGIFKNKTTVKTIDFENAGVKQADTLFLWYSTPFGNSGFNFSAEGLYGLTYNKSLRFQR